jgi:GNAT superfamily N-acetyltransferase
VPSNYNFEFKYVPYTQDIFVSVLGAEDIKEDEFETCEATFFQKIGGGYRKIGFVRYRQETGYKTKDDLLCMACSYCESAVEAINNCVIHTFDENDIYIEEVRVCDEHRGKGYGKVILKWISEISDDTNIIFLTVEYSDDSLFEFYEKNLIGYAIEGVNGRTMTFQKY